MAVYMRIVGTLALWVMLVGADPAWSVNRAEQDALLAKLQRAVESKAVVAAKTARPVAKRVSGAAHAAIIEKLRAVVVADREAMTAKQQAIEPDATAAWLVKLAERARVQQATTKMPLFVPRAGKRAAVLQADEDADGSVAIELSNVVDGSLMAGDTDGYVFNATAGSAVVISLTSEDFDSLLELEHMGEVVATNDDGGEDFNALLEDFVLPVDGEYTIRVRSFDDSGTGVYQLSLSESQKIVFVGALNGAATGTLPMGGRHYYTFATTDQTQVVLNLISEDFDTFLTLYAGDSPEDAVADNRLFLNDDSGEGSNSQVVELLAAGSYLIEVRAFSSATLGDYALSLNTVLIGGDEDAVGPMAITFGDTVQGELFPVGDTDAWIFDGSAGELVEISMASVDFDTYLELELNGEAIVINDDGGEGWNSLLSDFVLPASGQYTIRARSFDNNGAGIYQLSIVATSSNFSFNGSIGSGVQEGTLPVGGLQFYSFEVADQAKVQIDLVSEEFDPFLVLYVGDGLEDRNIENRLLLDDDGGSGYNARITAVLAAGVYLAEVRSFREGAEDGAFTLDLSLTDLSADEDEDGPVAIDFEQTANGSIFPAGDIDAYVFNGEAGMVVEVGLESPDFDTFLEVEYNGAVIASNDDGGTDFNSLLGDFVLPASGEYIIRAHELGDNGTGGYSLTLTQAEVPIELQALIEPGNYTGTISASSNVHLYSFTATSFSSVQIDLISEDFDAFLVLYEGDGVEDRSESNVVAFNDDGSTGLNSRIAALVTPGVYLIEARPLSIGQTGAYSLELAQTFIEGDEDDPSTPLATYGDSLVGQILPAGDTDGYTFTGLAGDAVTIDLVSEDFDTFLELIRDGERIAFDDDGGVDLNSRLEDFALPVDGEYLIRVRELNDDATGAYGLRLINATPPVTLKDPLEQGTTSDSLTAGGIDLYLLTIAERTDAQIDLTATDFAPALALYAGAGVEDRRADNLVTIVDSVAVQIVQELSPGTYLVEVRAADEASGGYALDLKLEPIQIPRDGIALNAGELNGLALNPFSPVVTVEPATKITGTVNLTVTNTRAGNEVFPVGATPTWGERQSSYWEIDNWASTGDTPYEVTVDLIAPREVGTYYLIFAAAPELTVADIMSGTHWVSQPAENWEDDDDVAAWDEARLQQAISRGWVNVDWFEGYNADIGATAIRIEVVESAALPAGPVALDLDPTTGDQAQRQLDEVITGQMVEVQLHIAEVEAISGWSGRIEYDPDKVAYVGNSFVPSNFIPGLVPLVDEKDRHVEVGGTLLGTGDPGEGNGMLGTVSFLVGEGFSYSTDLVVTQVSLRTVASGRIKQQVRSVATLSSGGLAMEQTGPVSMDFDLAAGDQQDREGEGAVTGATFELQLNVDGAPEMRGWSVRIEYDPTQVRYVPNSFRGSSFLSGLVPLVGEKSRRVDVGGAVLGSDATAQGNGELGTVSFEILDGFSGRAEVVITQVSFNTTESGEVIEQVRATATFSDATVGPTGDFSGDGQVDFSDFFLFADHFGFGEGDAGYDATYDLNASGEVDFSDFFIFADSFNVGIQGKLMALAREYIGLPEVSSVEQNYPNPFNGATTIAYHVVRPGPVQLDIYDIGGQRVQQLADGFHATGSYRAVWDGTNRRGRAMASGVYFYALRAEGVQQLRKMLYVK